MAMELNKKQKELARKRRTTAEFYESHVIILDDVDGKVIITMDQFKVLASIKEELEDNPEAIPVVFNL
jgi:hypothetical protein